MIFIIKNLNIIIMVKTCTESLDPALCQWDVSSDNQDSFQISIRLRAPVHPSASCYFCRDLIASGVGLSTRPLQMI